MAEKGTKDGAPDGSGSGDGRITPQGTSTSGQSSFGSQGRQESSADESRWSPNEELLKSLVDMGISPTAAEKALFFTGNSSVELAATWIFENDGSEEDDLPLTDSQKAGTASGCLNVSRTDELKQRAVREMFKMVFVVNSSLEMGVGKIAAQVAHAAIALHSILLQNESKFGDSLLKWFDFGETKIVLKGDTSKHLIDLQSMAMNRGIACYLVQDAGKTQVPKGSVTVFALFGRVDIVDSVTGSLKLL